MCTHIWRFLFHRIKVLPTSSAEGDFVGRRRTRPSDLSAIVASDATTVEALAKEDSSVRSFSEGG